MQKLILKKSHFCLLNILCFQQIIWIHAFILVNLSHSDQSILRHVLHTDEKLTLMCFILAKYPSLHLCILS